MELRSKDIKQQKLDELKNIFPEIFEDGKINYDKFKTILDENIDEKSEHYSFNWSGKKECYQTIKAKTNATLKVDEDKTVPHGENVFIEGDNLEVLKLLQTSYHKKIKMIYIDPPYNKDKDFVYKDTWGDTITNYLIQTDQLREEGYTSSKTSSTGRRHTNWLNMMYPRLWLGRNLLKDDGVIFVSIDDDEVANLRKVMDEIYGEENFVANICHKARASVSNDKIISSNHNHILFYAKNYEFIFSNRKNIGLNPNLDGFEKDDNDGKGKYKYTPVDGPGGALKGNPYYTFEGVTGYFRYSKEEMQKKYNEGEVVKVGNGLQKKYYLEYAINTRKTDTTWWDEKLYTSSATTNLKNLMDGDYFTNPKPVNLIKRMLEQTTSNNDIILDFFAGSGTTAHAVMELNQEDEKNGKIGNRKYILVQLPEATDENSEAYKAGYKKISDITKERIKRVIQSLDYKEGFKAFYLDNSNFQIFKEVKKRPNESLEEIEKMLKMSMFHENILTQGAKELDLVYEVGLKNGFTLSAKTEALKTDKYSFTKLSEDEREFYFCFDKKIENDILFHMPKNAKLICYEKALGDSVKLNLHENLDLDTL
jgi:adenine-specific DNA-methyltransferase